MKPGESIIIEKCANGFIVHSRAAELNLQDLHVFSDLGDSRYTSDITLLRWLQKHFEEREEQTPPRSA